MAKILVIEDDLTQSMMYEVAFTNAGYKVVVANSGKDGIAKARSEAPDLIYCDMILGDLTGQEVIRTLKTDPATQNLKIVALSNLNKKEVQDEVLQLGAEEFLVKMQYVPKDIVAKTPGYLKKVKNLATVQ
jgi:CheY-like chemotaxis protein